MTRNHFSNSNLKRLGERLRKSKQPTPEDVRALGEYRSQHLQTLLAANTRLASEPLISDCRVSGRLKNTQTIVEKLAREKTALHKMQDIAGLRVVLRPKAGYHEQSNVIRAVRSCFHYGVNLWLDCITA